MTATAKKNLPATKTALVALNGSDFQDIRSAFYQTAEGIGTLVRKLENSSDPRLAELHAMFSKMDALLTDSALGAVL